MLALPADEAHLWILEPEVVDRAALDRVVAHLSEDELERFGHLTLERVRLEFLATRALARGVLSQYADVGPADWRFVKNAHGCPAIGAPAEHAAIRFNLTNTPGMIAALVVRDRDVGVDVEDTRRRGDTVRIADRFFAEAEVAELLTRPVDRQRARFFDYWTLKEAYIKARGMGLAIPLGDFAFVFGSADDITVKVDPRQNDDASSWQFFQHRPNDRHLVSGAIRRGAAPALHIAIHRAEPVVRGL